MRRVILDIEHTGFGYKAGDRMVEIGGVEVVNGITTSHFFHSYLNPQAPINYHAQKIHGLSLGFLADKPLFSQVAQELISFIGDAQVLLHNARCDLIYLNGELKLADKFAISRSRVLDTLSLARRAKLPKPGLDGMIRDLGILVSKRGFHTALSDAIILAEAVRLLENPDAEPQKIQLPSRNSLRRLGIGSRQEDQKNMLRVGTAIAQNVPVSMPTAQSGNATSSREKELKKPPARAPWWIKKKFQKVLKAAKVASKN